MRNSELNPRSKKLGFWDGYINYNFPKSKKLLFVNSNLNKIKDCVTIYSKNLKIVIEDNSMKFFYVKKNKEKITRLQNPKLKQVIKLENNNYYKKMINSLFKNKKNFNKYKKKKILLIKSLLCALWSSKVKSEVKINYKKISAKYYKKWPVS